jgi:hypothetical protein
MTVQYEQLLRNYTLAAGDITQALKSILTVALITVGGASLATASTEIITGNYPPTEFCEEGIFQIGSEYRSFEDIILDAHQVFDLNSLGEIYVYGYIRNVRLPTNAWERTDVSVGPGDRCYWLINQGVAVYENRYDVLFVPGDTEIGEENYREIRRTLMRSNNLASGTALVKIRGSFHSYSNSGHYFRGISIEVIDTLEDYRQRRGCMRDPGC